MKLDDEAAEAAGGGPGRDARDLAGRGSVEAGGAILDKLSPAARGMVYSSLNVPVIVARRPIRVLELVITVLEALEGPPSDALLAPPSVPDPVVAPPTLCRGMASLASMV